MGAAARAISRQYAQFSPITPRRLDRNELKRDTELTGKSDNSDKASELKKVSKTSLYNANASETKSESGKEALEDPENAEEAEANHATSLRGSLRRSASDCELRYSSYQSISPNKTPTREGDKPLRLPSLVLGSREYGNVTTGTHTTPKPVQYEGERVKQSVPAERILQNISRDISTLYDASTSLYDKIKRQNFDLKGEEIPMLRILGMRRLVVDILPRQSIKTIRREAI